MARVTLAQPETRNCIGEGLAEELRDACRRIGEDDDFRLAIVTGSGGCFSVGRPELESGDEDEDIAGRLARLRVADSVAGLAIPVIIALNGDAMGQGLELALAGDLRVAADTARLALYESGRESGQKSGRPGFPWDGGTQRLPRLVGPAWALDLALTGRCLEAQEALSIGLVNRVASRERLEEATQELAEQVLATAPIAARYGKEAVRKGMDMTLAQGLGLEADLSVILQSTADRAEGIASFKEKRQPKFTGT